ncbi:MAG: hypothetical protein JXB47_11565 [Anaerolineae bacterium]|nr:hypothetical protein [Anaerolineae bacterium]
MVSPPREPVAYRIVICTAGRAPLLDEPRLARIAAETWNTAASDPIPTDDIDVAPDQVRATVHTGDLVALNRRVERYKSTSEIRLCDAITRLYPDVWLDKITRYSPVWPGVIYRIWEEGYHCRPVFFW